MNNKKMTAGIVAAAAIGAIAMTAGANHNGRILTLNLKGTGHMYEGTVPDIDGDGIDDDAICFDVDLFNVRNGHLIGTATDCLANINPDGNGLNLVGTSYFNFNGGAQLITRGETTVQPGLSSSLAPFTHVTGAAPSGGNDVVSGTRRFSNASGSVRLSGLVDMSAFGGNVGDPITFDCLFIVNLDNVGDDDDD